MSSVWEDMKQSVWKEAQEEAAKQANEATARRLLKLGKLNVTDIAKAVGFQLTEVQAIAQELGLVPAV